MGILSLPLRPLGLCRNGLGLDTATPGRSAGLCAGPGSVSGRPAFLGRHWRRLGWLVPLGPWDPFFPWYHYGGIYLNIVNVTNMRNVTNITNITNINNIHYAYKTIATTAVPTSVFSSGQPVAHHVVRVPPDQLEKAEIIPHPPANPTRSALTPGKPVSPPPVRTQRLVAANKNGEGAGRPAHAQSPQKRPAGNSARTSPPEASGKPQPSTRMSPPRLITRATPPPPTIPLRLMRPAMSEHPGRPLEPQQIEALRSGRQVAPMQDRVFPPHRAPVLPERPATMPHPMPKVPR